MWLAGWVLMTLSAASLLFLPHPWPTVVLLLALVLLMLGWTLITVPWLAPPVTLSRDDDQRLAFNSAREAMLLFGTLLAMLRHAVFAPEYLITVAAFMLLLLLVAVLYQGSHRPPPGTEEAPFRHLLAEPRVSALAVPWF